jgi:hypothetical protein
LYGNGRLMSKPGIGRRGSWSNLAVTFLAGPEGWQTPAAFAATLEGKSVEAVSVANRLRQRQAAACHSAFTATTAMAATCLLLAVARPSA